MRFFRHTLILDKILSLRLVDQERKKKIKIKIKINTDSSINYQEKTNKQTNGVKIDNNYGQKLRSRGRNKGNYSTITNEDKVEVLIVQKRNKLIFFC